MDRSGRGEPAVVVAIRHVGGQRDRKADLVTNDPSGNDLSCVIRAAVAAVQIAVRAAEFAFDAVPFWPECERDVVDRVAPAAGERAWRRDPRRPGPKAAQGGRLRAGRTPAPKSAARNTKMVLMRESSLTNAPPSLVLSIEKYKRIKKIEETISRHSRHEYVSDAPVGTFSQVWRER